jgi:pimeloyl-ACP methyl ester carboxylesterase
MQERKTNGIGYLVRDWPLDPEKSTIVFIHGAGGSSLFWQAQINGLSAHVNTVAIDLPGHGRSQGTGKNKVDEYARTVVDLIQAIDVPKPIACGFSLGGAISQLLLLDYPNRFESGILISTGSKMPVVPAFFKSIENDYNGFVEWISKLAASKKTDRKLVSPFRDDFLRCKPEITHSDFEACHRFDVSDRLPAVDVPVLVVTAEEDRLTPPDYGAFLEQQIKNASRAHIMDAGHIVPMEKPDEINKTILKFLDQTGL